MFTGIVQTVSPIVSVSARGGARRVRIAKPARWKLTRGQSVNVDGICSTVVAHAAHSFHVEYMPETLKKTTASLFERGTRVNLERSLRFGDPIDGHLVQGHVDARVRVVATVDKGRSRDIVIALSSALGKKIALHGSIAVNGVSLTIARKGRNTVAVALIPFTLARTNLGEIAVGDYVNVELDHTPELVRESARGTVGRNAAKRVRKKARRA